MQDEKPCRRTPARTTGSCGAGTAPASALATPSLATSLVACRCPASIPASPESARGKQMGQRRRCSRKGRVRKADQPIVTTMNAGEVAADTGLTLEEVEQSERHLVMHGWLIPTSVPGRYVMTIGEDCRDGCPMR